MIGLKYEVWEDCGDPTQQYLLAQFPDENSAIEFMEKQYQGVKRQTSNQVTMGFYVVAYKNIAHKEIWRNWNEMLRPEGWENE